MNIQSQTLRALPVVISLVLCGAAAQVVVMLPFTDDFSDTLVGDWVQNNGTYTHNGSTLTVASGANIGGASVQVPTL